MGNSENLSSSQEDVLSIQLDQTSFYPGTTICGVLLANTSSPCQVTHLGLWIDGHSSAEWTSPQGGIIKTQEVSDSFVKLQFP